MPKEMAKNEFEDIVRTLHDAVFALSSAGRFSDAGSVQTILDAYAKHQWQDFVPAPGSREETDSIERRAKVEADAHHSTMNETDMMAKSDSVMNPHNKEGFATQKSDMGIADREDVKVTGMKKN